MWLSVYASLLQRGQNSLLDVLFVICLESVVNALCQLFLPPFAGQVLFFLAVVNEAEFDEYAWHAHFAQNKETGLVHTLVHAFCRGGKLFLDQTGEVYAGCHVLVLHEFEDYVRLAAVGVEILVGLLVVLLQCDYRVLSLCNGKIVGGSIKLDGQELVNAGEGVMKTVRGNKVSIIFQDPMTSLNPTYTIGHQLMEAIMLHTPRNKQQAWDRAVEMLRLVNINEPEKRMKQYPFEFSGGMRQRVMIAMALACEPDILIADEPTTALDVTIQAQILELMQSLQKELGMAIIMITHDLGVVAQMCDEVIVMYAGSICEQGSADEIFYNPKHEYTKGLMRSIPTVDSDGSRLQPISGTPIDLLNMPAGCPFAPRCDAAMKICMRQRCERMTINEAHQAACWMNVKEAFEKGELEEATE